MLFPWLKSFSSFTLEKIISKPFAIVYNTVWSGPRLLLQSPLMSLFPVAHYPPATIILFHSWNNLWLNTNSFPTSNPMYIFLSIQYGLLSILPIAALSHSSQLKCNLKEVSFATLCRPGPPYPTILYNSTLFLSSMYLLQVIITCLNICFLVNACLSDQIWLYKNISRNGKANVNEKHFKRRINTFLHKIWW